MVKPSCTNSCPESPLLTASGTYTTIVVMVEAIMDDVTTLVPASAASLKSGFFSCIRKQLSITTMEESTIIPMAMTREPIVTIFSEYPMAFIRINVTKSDTGMDAPTINDALISPKNRNRTTIDSTIPRISVCPTDQMESTMVSLAS